MEGDAVGFTIRGIVKGNTSTVTFVSTFSMKPGEAVITRKGKLLYWKITIAPEGEFYIPKEAVLKSTDKK